MTDKTCPHCGQAVPSVEPFGVKLSPMQEKIAVAVRAAGQQGIAQERLFEKIYGDRADGGPMSETLKQHVCHLNRKLAAIGKEVRSSGGGGPMGYRGRYYYRDKGERHSRVA